MRRNYIIIQSKSFQKNKFDERWSNLWGNQEGICLVFLLSQKWEWQETNFVFVGSMLASQFHGSHAYFIM